MAKHSSSSSEASVDLSALEKEIASLKSEIAKLKKDLAAVKKSSAAGNDAALREALLAHPTLSAFLKKNL